MNEFIITCEHAGNEIPDEYTFLFKGKEDQLYTHKAIDFGALDQGRKIADTLNVEFYYTSISRLLIEANRSEGSEELFSEHSKDLSDDQKKDILFRYYKSHRDQVESVISEVISKGKKVIHIASHTFTPAKDGEVRDGDIGILFDPSRSWEKSFCETFKSKILQLDDSLMVKENFPYPGTDDGFPTYLRKRFKDDFYIGVELEVNQKYYLSSEPERWENLKATIASALLAIQQGL